MSFWIIFLVFLFGAIIGSFLNVVIMRYHSGRGLGGRSICMSCSKELEWHELIPILSFFMLKGRCPRCKSRISPAYPIVEILTGLVFVLIFQKLSFLLPASPYFFIFLLIYYFLVFSFLIVIAVYDQRHKFIPNGLVYPFILISLFSFFITPDLSSFSNFNPANLLGGFAVALPLFLIWLFSRGKLMGFGDVKLGLGLGFLLGLSEGLVGLFLAFWLGAVTGIVLIIFSSLRKFTKNKIGMRTELPFAPFMIAGAALAFMLNIDLGILANFFQAIQF